MQATPRTAARFPAVPPTAGHYESFYLKATRPDSGQAVWIRYTVWKAPGGRPVGALWCTLFDAGLPRPVAWKASFPGPGVRPGEYIHMGGGRLTANRAEGPSWRMNFTGDDLPFPYLQRRWMYRAPVPRTKAESLHPTVRLSGYVEVAGRRLDLEGWRGMFGHNWGSEHAERWVWLHGTGFTEAPDAVLDVTLGKIKVGGWISPWIANGLIELDGTRHRLGGLQRLRGLRVDETPDRCACTLADRRLGLCRSGRWPPRRASHLDRRPRPPRRRPVPDAPPGRDLRDGHPGVGPPCADRVISRSLTISPATHGPNDGRSNCVPRRSGSGLVADPPSAIEPEGSGSRVTWSMTAKRTLMTKVMGILKSMDKLLGPDFETGLAG